MESRFNHVIVHLSRRSPDTNEVDEVDEMDEMDEMDEVKED